MIRNMRIRSDKVITTTLVLRMIGIFGGGRFCSWLGSIQRPLTPPPLEMSHNVRYDDHLTPKCWAIAEGNMLAAALYPLNIRL